MCWANLLRCRRDRSDGIGQVKWRVAELRSHDQENAAMVEESTNRRPNSSKGSGETTHQVGHQPLQAHRAVQLLKTPSHHLSFKAEHAALAHREKLTINDILSLPHPHRHPRRWLILLAVAGLVPSTR